MVSVNGYRIKEEDVINLVAGAVIAAIALFLFFRNPTFELGLQVVFAAVIAVAAREFGQRTVANFMHGRIESNFSTGGGAISIVFGCLALVFQAPLALIVPLYSNIRYERHELWGYDVDVLWSKRKYWIGAAGVTTVLLTWIPFYLLDLKVISASLGVFALSQMAPFNETEFFEGRTDGAHILLVSGLAWLLLTGLSVTAVFVSL